MIGIYVHLPFCLRKCPYCAFFSESNAQNKMEAYVKRVVEEAKKYPPQEVETIYFGGGTPTLLPADLLVFLLKSLLEHFPCKGEITIESNPATVSRAFLKELRDAGFNRVSIGVQSLIDDELLFLGRMHTAQDAINSIKDAKAAGFLNVSADIMFGLPNQTCDNVKYTLQKLISLSVQHISAYSLSIEEGTPFSKRDLSLPSEDAERGMYTAIIETLKAHNFVHYEISNFSLPGFEAVHNTNYWKCGEYIGLGAGAHSYFQGVRYNNIENIDMYLSETNAVENRVVLTESDKREEYYMLGLRLLRGVKADNNPNIPRLVRNGLLEFSGENIRLTKRGIDLANYVITELFI